MVNTVNRLQKRNFLFGNFEGVNFGKGILPKGSAFRVYSVNSQLWVYTRPLIHLLLPGASISVETSAVKGKGTIRFHLYLAKQPVFANQYISLLNEPYEVVHEIHPTVIQFAPPLGTIFEGPWAAITDEVPSSRQLGIAYAQWLHRRADFKTFSIEALLKAKELLIRLCEKHEFIFTDEHIRKGAIKIDRRDGAFYIHEQFRCLTSDYHTPKDDQVAQKMLALTNPITMDHISTLSGKDKALIRESMKLSKN